MPPDVSRCPQHGYHDGPGCPECGGKSECVIDGAGRRRLSKFVSGALRHFPEDAGITLDDAEWARFEAVVEDAREVGARHGDEPVVLAVDATGMCKDGHRIVKRGTTTYTTDAVPWASLEVL